MIQDIDLSNRETHIYYWDDEELLFPRLDLYPNTNIYPVGVDEVPNIVSGSMKLDELIVENDMRFGELYSTKFEVTLYNMPEDISNKFIQVVQVDNGIYKSIFSGKIISCKLDNTGYDRTIVAYDMAYVYRDKNVADWWTEFWSDKGESTIKECRESLLDYMGIEYPDRLTLTNDSVTIRKTLNATYIAFNTVFTMLCELNACFPHLSRDNVMEFIQLKTSPKINIDGLYEGLESTFEDYTTDKITGIEFYDSEGELKYVVGDIQNTYKLSSNIFCYDMSTWELKKIGNAILNVASKITYTPANVKMIVGDLSYTLGSRITTSKGNFYIFENNYSSAQLVEQTMSAKGEKSLGESSRSLTDEMIILNEKYSRLTFNVEEFRLEFGNYQQEVSSMFQQTADKITLEVKKGTENFKATYQGDYIPTKKNFPAKDWNTENLKAQNVGATFYDTKQGRVYRWSLIPNAVCLTFSKDCNFAYGDYLKVLAMDGNALKSTVEFDKKNLAGRTIVIPTTEFYVYFHAGRKSSTQYYGFSIENAYEGYAENKYSDITMHSTMPTGQTIELKGITSLPESEHNPYLSGDKLWHWDTGIKLTETTDRYGWIPQEGFMSSKIQQTADKIQSEVSARKFADDGMYKDYTSKFEQTAEKIEAKVSKGDVSSSLSVEPDTITLKGDRLIIKSTNCELTKDGTLTVQNAKIKGDFETGSGNDMIEIKNRYIRNPSTGNYIDMNGTGYEGSGIHMNSNVIVFSTTNLGVAYPRGSSTVRTGKTGDIHFKYLTEEGIWSEWDLHVVNGLIVD